MTSNQALFDSIRRKASLRTSVALVVRICAVLLLICMLIGAKPGRVSALGNTYYVDNTVQCADGSTSGGGTMALPFCTIRQGAGKAKLPGDTVYVLAGTYAETVNTAYSGTEGNPITFKANPGVTVTGAVCPPEDPCSGSGFLMGSKSYIVIDGFKVSGTRGKAVHILDSHHMTIKNNEVSYAGDPPGELFHESQGIVLNSTTHSIVSNNVTHHNSCAGIRLVDRSDYNVISNNTSFANASLHRFDAAGIDLMGSSHNIIINNTVYGNEDSGISIYAFTDQDNVPLVTIQSTYNVSVGNLSYGNADHGIDHNNAPYNTVIGNTFHGNGTVGINFEGGVPEEGSHHGLVMNNIVTSNGFQPVTNAFGGNLRVDTNSVPGTVVDYNIYRKDAASVDIIWDNEPYLSLNAFRSAVGGQDLHSVEGDPKFVDPVDPVLRVDGVSYSSDVTGDYHLLASSPAIDRANADAPFQLETDLFFNPRVDDLATTNRGAGAREYDDIGAIEFQPAIAEQSPATVLTVSVTNVETTSVKLTGHLTNLGTPNATEYGFVWGTAENPTTANNKISHGAPSSTGEFAGPLTGLTPGTLYHVRAYAMNTAGTVYGSDMTFTTLLSSAVYTQPVSNITTTAAIGNGVIDALGATHATEYGLVWGTAANPTTANNKVVGGTANGAGEFSGVIPNLMPGTLYHVRAYAIYNVGTVYGEDVTFTTLLVPTVTTLPVSGVAATTATANGNINIVDAAIPTDYGVVWGTSVNPTIAGSKISGGPVDGSGNFTASIPALKPATLYHVRSYVTYEGKTVYGADLTFTTKNALFLPYLTR